MVLDGLVKWEIWINKRKLNAGVSACVCIRTCMCLISSTSSVIPIFILLDHTICMCVWLVSVCVCVCACEKLLLSIYAARILNNNVQQSYVPKFSRFHRFDELWRVLTSSFSPSSFFSCSHFQYRWLNLNIKRFELCLETYFSTIWIGERTLLIFWTQMWISI